MLPKIPRLTPFALFTSLLSAQSPPRHPTTLSLGAEYSNTSSHIILGASNNRRLTGLDLTLSTRLKQNRILTWTYDLELRPVEFLQDPVSTTTITLQPPNAPTLGPFPLQNGPIQGACQSFVLPNPPGLASDIPLTETRTCATRWTYAGGLSPLGQRFNFRPAHRLQPYALLNAGFLVSPRDIPSNNSSPLQLHLCLRCRLSDCRDPYPRLVPRLPPSPPLQPRPRQHQSRRRQPTPPPLLHLRGPAQLSSPLIAGLAGDSPCAVLPLTREGIPETHFT